MKKETLFMLILENCVKKTGPMKTGPEKINAYLSAGSANIAASTFGFNSTPVVRIVCD